MHRAFMVAAITHFVLGKSVNPVFGGERGIRTLDTGLSPYASLAGKCLRPLGQLSNLYLLFTRRFNTKFSTSSLVIVANNTASPSSDCA